jgi:hypothetical protein
MAITFNDRLIDAGHHDIAPEQEAKAELIGRYMPERSRPAKWPGGQECMDCGCIFIGEEWHTLCAVCARQGGGA